MVVAIIAILASMLLPVLQTARHQARMIVCGNMRQVALAATMYAYDNSEFFPHRETAQYPTWSTPYALRATGLLIQYPLSSYPKVAWTNKDSNI